MSYQVTSQTPYVNKADFVQEKVVKENSSEGVPSSGGTFLTMDITQEVSRAISRAERDQDFGKFGKITGLVCVALSIALFIPAILTGNIWCCVASGVFGMNSLLWGLISCDDSKIDFKALRNHEKEFASYIAQSPYHYRLLQERQNLGFLIRSFENSRVERSLTSK